MLRYNDSLYDVFAIRIDQQMIDQAGSKRILQFDQLFEFGNGTDILKSLYSVPSVSISLGNNEVLIPKSLMANKGKIQVILQQFQVNYFDYISNTTSLNNIISSIGNITIITDGSLVNLTTLSEPITILLRKKALSPKAMPLNLTL